ncbi:hypothetical protein E2X65_23445 [Salmonella enterica]|nr:hypothetical protein [Salmonella enterica]
MNNKSLLLLLMGALLLNGCSKSSSIDARKTGYTSPRTDISSMTQLTDQDVFGNELTLEITEEDIQNAVEEAKGQFEIPLNSAIVLVRSGSRAPDVMMQKEMQRYYKVSTFSGIPVIRKKRAVQPVASVKEAVSDIVENDVDGKSGVINANYMQALRYIAAKGRNKAIVVYWDELEMGKFNAVTKEVVWKKYNGEKLAGSSLRYLIRFALVDVASGEWATWSPVNTESMAVPLTTKLDVKTGEKNDITEQQILALEKKTCQMVVSDLIKRYSH